MIREEIIRMARKAELIYWHPNSTFSDGVWWMDAGEPGDELERFAALVAAAKDAEHAKKLKNDIHLCGPTCTRYACVSVREAVEAEREACAKVCEGIKYEGYVPPEDGAAANYYNEASMDCADAIRARKDNT